MKDKRIQVKVEIKEEKNGIIRVPKGCFHSDTFVCEKCGCRGIYKVLGNTKTCPECGGTMYRQ